MSVNCLETPFSRSSYFIGNIGLASHNYKFFSNSKNVELGSFRPRCQKHRISCSEVRDFNCNGIGDRKLGFYGVNQCKRNSSFRLKSVLDVDKVLESDGSVGLDRNTNYDAIVIGSGIGGLVAATQLAVRGARVLVLEKYLIPGGSSGFYQRDGFTFDVGSSVMFGFSDKVLSCSYCCPPIAWKEIYSGTC